MSTSTAPKVFDVAHPGKGKTAPTSKEILVTNRPVLRDPMVVGESDDEVSKPSSSPVVTRITLKPLDDMDEKPGEQKVISEPAQPEAAGTDTPEAVPDAPEAPEEKKTGEAKNEEKSEPVSAPEPEAKPESSASEPEKAGIDEASSSDVGAATHQKEADKAAQQELARQQELEEIIESKKYFVPINAVAQRRTMRTLFILLVAVILLAVVAADLALDAGWLHYAGVKPLTDFFKG